MNYFYAYHGPDNQEPFDFSGGYGFKTNEKVEKIQEGDLVFVIQCLKQEGKRFKLCGLYPVSGDEINDEVVRKHRVKFSAGPYSDRFVDLDEDEVGALLPEIVGGSKGWSNFKKHFCAQGISLRNPLDVEVVEVLLGILKDDLSTSPLYGDEEPPVGAVIESYEELEREFRKKVVESLSGSSEQRLARLATAATQPVKRVVSTYVYNRNPDVVAEALYRAKGQCQSCLKPAPFNRKTDDTPYLEVHHIKPLAEGGDDTLENTKALCPNCHRKAHHG